MNSPEHTWFLLAYDYEWNAISAIATAIATLVALCAPFILRWQDRRTTAKENRAHNREIVETTVQGFERLIFAFRQFNIGAPRGPFDFNVAAARASSHAATLRVLAQRQGIQGDAIAGALATAEALDHIRYAENAAANALKLAGRAGTDQRYEEIKDQLTAALVLAKEAQARIDTTVTKGGLTVRGGELIITLPKTISEA